MAKGLREWELQHRRSGEGKLSIAIWQVNSRTSRNSKSDSADILHICGKHRNFCTEPWEGEKVEFQGVILPYVHEALGHSSGLALMQ